MLFYGNWWLPLEMRSRQTFDTAKRSTKWKSLNWTKTQQEAINSWNMNFTKCSLYQRRKVGFKSYYFPRFLPEKEVLGGCYREWQIKIVSAAIAFWITFVQLQVESILKLKCLNFSIKIDIFTFGRPLILA